MLLACIMCVAPFFSTQKESILSGQQTNTKAPFRQQHKHDDPLLNDVSAVIIEQQRHGEGRPRRATIKTPAPLIRESAGKATSTHGVPVWVPSLFGKHWKVLPVPKVANTCSRLFSIEKIKKSGLINPHFGFVGGVLYTANND